jgi:hypothetical protein
VTGGRQQTVPPMAASPGEYAAAPQLLVIQQPPDLGQPGIGERTVVIPGRFCWPIMTISSFRQ